MQTNHLIDLKELIDAAFEAVGCRMPVEVDENGLYVRDLIIELDGAEFLCFEAKNPERPLFTMEVNSLEDVAARTAIHILSGIISRAVNKS